MAFPRLLDLDLDLDLATKRKRRSLFTHGLYV
jgi:hypothetical protein